MAYISGHASKLKLNDASDGERWLSEADEQGNCTAYVTVEAPAASNTQITTDKRSFPATFKFLIDNIAHLFANKVNKTIADNTSNATRYLTFTNTQTDTDLRTDNDLTYNPSTGVLTTTSFTGNLTGLAEKATGDKNGADITTTYATKTERSDNDITAVSLSGNTIILTKGDATTITATVGSLSVNTSGNAATATKLANSRSLTISGKATGNANFDGSADATINLTAVTLIESDIPNLGAGKITSGTLNADRLPLSFTTDTTNKKYAVEKDTSGKLFVAVPWTDTIYTHPTGDGNLHVPATGTTSNGKFLMAGATAGVFSWGTPTNTTYSALANGGLTLSSGNAFSVNAKDKGGIEVGSDGVKVKTEAVGTEESTELYRKCKLHIDTDGVLYIYVKPTVTFKDATAGTVTSVTLQTL